MDLYNKCLKFSENPKSGNQVYQGLVAPLAIALACPRSDSPSTERRVEYYANCEISIGWWRLLQTAKPVDYIVMWGRGDHKPGRKSPVSLLCCFLKWE